LGLEHVPDSGDCSLEGVDGVAVGAAHGYEDEGLEAQPEGVGALLPQFTSPDAAWLLALQIVALGLVHVASTDRARGVGQGTTAVP